MWYSQVNRNITDINRKLRAGILLPLQLLKENNFKVYIKNPHLLELKFFPVFNLEAHYNVMTQGKKKDVLLKQEVDFGHHINAVMFHVLLQTRK